MAEEVEIVEPEVKRRKSAFTYGGSLERDKKALINFWISNFGSEANKIADADKAVKTLDDILELVDESTYKLADAVAKIMCLEQVVNRFMRLREIWFDYSDQVFKVDVQQSRVKKNAAQIQKSMGAAKNYMVSAMGTLLLARLWTESNPEYLLDHNFEGLNRNDKRMVLATLEKVEHT